MSQCWMYWVTNLFSCGRAKAFDMLVGSQNTEVSTHALSWRNWRMSAQVYYHPPRLAFESDHRFVQWITMSGSCERQLFPHCLSCNQVDTITNIANTWVWCTRRESASDAALVMPHLYWIPYSVSSIWWMPCVGFPYVIIDRISAIELLGQFW